MVNVLKIETTGVVEGVDACASVPTSSAVLCVRIVLSENPSQLITKVNNNRVSQTKGQITTIQDSVCFIYDYLLHDKILFLPSLLYSLRASNNEI